MEIYFCRSKLLRLEMIYRSWKYSKVQFVFGHSYNYKQIKVNETAGLKYKYLLVEISNLTSWFWFNSQLMILYI